jgi:hypothetical protein
MVLYGWNFLWVTHALGFTQVVRQWLRRLAGRAALDTRAIHGLTLGTLPQRETRGPTDQEEETQDSEGNEGDLCVLHIEYLEKLTALALVHAVFVGHHRRPLTRILTLHSGTGRVLCERLLNRAIHAHVHCRLGTLP